jgi:hypothetical protein
MSEIVLRTIAVGIGATLVMDLWGLMLKHVYGVTGADYRLLGRWIIHLMRGQVRHDSIASVASVKAESPVGWIAHYAIGVVFAAVLVVIFGAAWLREPSILPAIFTGLITLAAPLFVMQPAFGLGIAASRTPKPNVARLRSLTTHLVFGTGLYIAARFSAPL